MVRNKSRKFVIKNAVNSSTESHTTEDAEGVRHEIEYTVYDCKYCGEGGIATKAKCDAWDTTAESVEMHLNREHPEKV